MVTPNLQGTDVNNPPTSEDQSVEFVSMNSSLLLPPGASSAAEKRLHKALFFSEETETRTAHDFLSSEARTAHDFLAYLDRELILSKKGSHPPPWEARTKVLLCLTQVD